MLAEEPEGWAALVDAGGRHETAGEGGPRTAAPSPRPGSPATTLLQRWMLWYTQGVPRSDSGRAGRNLFAPGIAVVLGVVKGDFRLVLTPTEQHGPAADRTVKVADA